MAALPLFVVVAAPASAQPYPPGPCRPTSSSQFLGSFPVGTTISAVLSPICVWTPGTGVVVTVNGQPVFTKPANSSGFVPILIAITSATVLSIDDPVNVTGQCGTNSVVGVGNAAVAQAVVTHTATFEVVCVQQVVARPSAIAFTGANLLRWALYALAALAIGFLLLVGTPRRSRAERPDVPVG